MGYLYLLQTPTRTQMQRTSCVNVDDSAMPCKLFQTVRDSPNPKHFFDVQGGPKKWGHKLMTIILSNLNRILKKNQITGRFVGKFVVKWIFKIPSHLAYVATLPCETLMSAKQAINDKLQGSTCTYLRCGGVVNNRIKKGLLLSL